MADPGTPEWWLERLDGELDSRLEHLDLLQRYAEGDHDKPTTPERASRAFRRLMGLSMTNLCGLVAETTAERLSVSGFRFGDNPDGDRDAWRIWQANDFDAYSELAVSAAVTLGRSYVSVEPNPNDPTTPLLHAEDPRQVVVAYAPGTRRERVAGLKRWVDDWTGITHATLYLPGSLYRVREARPRAGTTTRREWVDRDSGEPVVRPVRNLLGTVPFFELRNRPRLDGRVLSEFEDVMDAQDRANHISLNALIAAEYGAFRQKWATGIDVPMDPSTGQPIEPYDVAVNRLLVADGPDARFGDFNATDLKPYIELYESTVQHIAAVSRTPASYLLGEMVNLSAEALAAGEAGLVNKCARRAKHYEQAFEGAMRLAFRVAGDPRADATNAETIWQDMAIRSEAQATDAAVKKVQAGIVPPQQAQEDLGYSETQRARMRAWASEADAFAQLGALLDSQAAPVPAFGGEPQ